jgi:hypothetical protein
MAPLPKRKRDDSDRTTRLKGPVLIHNFFQLMSLVSRENEANAKPLASFDGWRADRIARTERQTRDKHGCVAKAMWLHANRVISDG